jgi:hypothetical protein
VAHCFDVQEVAHFILNDGIKHRQAPNRHWPGAKLETSFARLKFSSNFIQLNKNLYGHRNNRGSVMRQPATAAELRQALRNQEFQNIPMGKGQCPLMQAEVSIFPVRYALDESPQKGSSQGPNPLPANWPAGTLPPLKSRSYTLRQLRDGWLYVWNDTEKTFHEYQVEGEMLTRHKWADAQLNQDVRSNPWDTNPTCFTLETASCVSPSPPCSGPGACAS